MRRVIVFIILVFSFILFYMAPDYVNKGFCWLCLILYLIEVYLVLIIEFKSKIYLSFNALFFLSFFLTSFAYPLFVHDTPAELLGIVEQQINFNYLSKCSALCLIASSLYSFGFLTALNVRKCKGYNDRLIKTELPLRGLKVLKSIFVFIFLLLFLLALSAVLSGVTVYLEGGDLLSSLFETVFPVVLLMNTIKENPRDMKEFIKGNKFELGLGIITMLLFMKIGDRGLLLTCGMEIVIIYIVCVKRLRLITIGSLLIIGASLMFVIRQTRITDEFSSTTSSISSFTTVASEVLSQGGAEYGFWYYLSDLTNISWELCLGYEYSEKNGLFYPVEEIILTIASPIPMVPSLISNQIFKKPTSDYLTGMELNKYLSRFGDGNFGTHCVIDVYMMWGLIGVIIIFFFFGHIVALCYNKLFDNILYSALYVLLVANAIYVPRNIILSLIRPAVYVWFFVWLANYNAKLPRKSKKVTTSNA